MFFEAVGMFGWMSGRDPQHGSAAGFLRPIATEQIAQNLHLDEKAEKNGRRNLPTSESGVPDAVEQAIIQRIESEWRWQGGEFVNCLRAYASRLSVLSAASEFTELLVKADNALTRLRAAHYRAEAGLSPLKAAFLATRDECDRFRQSHGLSRQVRIGNRPWTTIGFASVIIAFEAVLNGFFFAKGAQFGLVGGIGTALGISFCNIVFAFLLGLFPTRWINHRNLGVKFIGSLLLALGSAALVILHAFAAQLRDVVGTAGEDRATAVAIEHLTTAPWRVDDFSSLYLFALGVAFALAAMWKGYFLDDPYPGYGAMGRRVEAARADYGEEHGELFDELEEIKDAALTTLQQGIAQIPLLPQQAAAIRLQRDAIVQNFRAYEGAVRSAANQLLERYRGANREHRTSPEPSRFKQSWNLPLSLLESAEVINLITDPPTAVIEMSTILKDLRDHSQAVLREYEGLLNKFPHAI